MCKGHAEAPGCKYLECSKTTAHICTHQHQDRAATELFLLLHILIKTTTTANTFLSATFNLVFYVFSCEDVAHPQTLQLQNHAWKIRPRCILKVRLKSSNLSLSEVCLLPAVNSGGGQMRSADRGKHGSRGGKQAASQYGKRLFCPKNFLPAGKNADYRTWQMGRTQVNHTSHVFHSFTTGCHVIEG